MASSLKGWPEFLSPGSSNVRWLLSVTSAQRRVCDSSAGATSSWPARWPDMQDLFAPSTWLFVILGGSMIFGAVFGWGILRYQDWRHRMQRDRF
jgi:hypothetical protein